MKIIFTGANYWQVNSSPGSFESDFRMVQGYRWIKSRKQFAKKEQMFACPKNYQMLTNDEAKAQGLM